MWSQHGPIGCLAFIGSGKSPDDCQEFRARLPLSRQTMELHRFVPGERNAAVCGGTDCGQPEDSSVHAVVPMGGQTVQLGVEEGNVCIGGGLNERDEQLSDHRPTVRGKEGRCFICEPMTVPEAIDLAEEMDCPECPHGTNRHGTEAGCVECPCRVGEAVRPPNVCEEPHETIEEEEACEAARLGLSAGAVFVTYAVHGGREHSLLVPPGATVQVIDGSVRIVHPGMPALGITRVETA